MSRASHCRSEQVVAWRQNYSKVSSTSSTSSLPQSCKACRLGQRGFISVVLVVNLRCHIEHASDVLVNEGLGQEVVKRQDCIGLDVHNPERVALVARMVTAATIAMPITM